MASKRPADMQPVVPSAQRSWTLLVGISVASTLGLAAALLPMLEQHFDSPWPWARTEQALLVLFPVLVLAAVAYLSREQRRAAAMHRAILEAREREAVRARRQNARLTALLNVSQIMGTEIELQTVFDAVTQTCREAFESEQVSLMLVDRNTQELVVRAASGHRHPERVLGSRQKIGEGVAGTVAAKCTPLLLGSAPLDPTSFQDIRQQAAPLSGAMVVPILVRGELVGVLNVASQSASKSYDEEDFQAMKVFAENVGSCIRHAEQADWMRQLIHRYTAAEGGAVAAAARPAPHPSR